MEKGDRTCTKCGQFKSADEFYKSTGGNVCKDCRRAYQRKLNLKKCSGHENIVSIDDEPQARSKQCAACSAILSTSDFYTDRRTSDGLSIICKKCNPKMTYIVGNNVSFSEKEYLRLYDKVSALADSGIQKDISSIALVLMVLDSHGIDSNKINGLELIHFVNDVIEMRELKAKLAQRKAFKEWKTSVGTKKPATKPPHKSKPVTKSAAKPATKHIAKPAREISSDERRLKAVVKDESKIHTRISVSDGMRSELTTLLNLVKSEHSIVLSLKYLKTKTSEAMYDAIKTATIDGRLTPITSHLGNSVMTSELKTYLTSKIKTLTLGVK